MNDGLYSTDFSFPGQTGFYSGKVRDVYEIQHKYLVIVATDRISAFDHILPEPIPQKGAILNTIAAQNLAETRKYIPNWFLSSPHPYVTIGYKCKPYPLEMIVRNYLCGHALRTYQKGIRTLCGNGLPEGLKPYQRLPEPLLTPTTKASEGHDEDTTTEAILQKKIVNEEEWNTLRNYSFKLFELGAEKAASTGLILADTKYEFGYLDGNILLIDEVHTPDSSRFFLKKEYEDSFAEDREPEQLSKEFARQWLISKGFSGEEGQSTPEMTPDVIGSIRSQYIKLFERFTGQPFDWDPDQDLKQAIHASVTDSLKNLE